MIIVLFYLSACDNDDSVPYPSSSSNDIIQLGTETHWLKLCEDDSVCGETLSCLCGICTQACENLSNCEDDSGNNQCLSTSEDIRC